MNRRGFILGMLAAPAVVKAGNIYVPARKIIPRTYIVSMTVNDVYFDGDHLQDAARYAFMITKEKQQWHHLQTSLMSNSKERLIKIDKSPTAIHQTISDARQS